jgi:catechol-2,3-dioxygenase
MTGARPLPASGTDAAAVLACRRVFDHVHLRVRDLAESRRFYEAVHRSAEPRASWSWIRWDE